MVLLLGHPASYGHVAGPGTCGHVFGTKSFAFDATTAVLCPSLFVPASQGAAIHRLCSTAAQRRSCGHLQPIVRANPYFNYYKTNCTFLNCRWENRTKGKWRTLLALAAIGHLVANLVLTSFLLMVSRANYPGGEALSLLHKMESYESNVTVHIDVLAAQTGISRFGQLHDNWM